ncbi:RNA methyltransferase [bacterium]|nr:RNA methyltransferase [bacterium]
MAKIITITSMQNDLVKYCVKLQNSTFRKQERLILFDGIKTIKGLIDDNVEFEYLFLEDENADFKTIKAKNIVITTNDVLKKISTLKTPQGAIGIVKEPIIQPEQFFEYENIALIENIKDSGNRGTIIRSACAFGVSGIILFGDCVDLYSPKTMRATAQNMFKIPIFRTNDINFIKKFKKTHKLISTVVNSKNNFQEYDFKTKSVLMFGSEASGLSDELVKLSDVQLTFPMLNNVESLNLAVFASIAFYHVMLKNA